MQSDTVTNIIAILFTAYGKADDIYRQGVYVTVLNNIPLDVLKAACNVLIANKPYLPSVADIITTAKDIAGNNIPLPWHEAWAEIQRQMHDAYVYVKPKFSRPEIEQTAMRFGWLNLCTALSDDMPTIYAQMRKIYEDICARNEEQRKYSLLAKHDVAGYISGASVELKPIGSIVAQITTLKGRKP